MRNWTSSLALILAVSLFSVAGACRGTVVSQPSDQQVQDVRALAIRVADAVKTGLVIADEAGKLADALPIPSAAKNRIDCAVLTVTGPSGTASPSDEAAVLKACGKIANAVLKTALAELSAITERPALLNTVQRIIAAVDPLVARLDESSNQSLRALASVLRAAFIFVRGIQ